jgi:hypothetical protein
MSADILSFPEVRYTPDHAVIFDVLDMVDPGDIGSLIDVAQMALRAVLHTRKSANNPTPKDYQSTIDGLAMACFALALAIGIPRDTLTDLPCGTP